MGARSYCHPSQLGREISWGTKKKLNLGQILTSPPNQLIFSEGFPYWQLLLLGQVKCLSNAPRGGSDLFYLLHHHFDYFHEDLVVLSTFMQQTMSDGQKLGVEAAHLQQNNTISPSISPNFRPLLKINASNMEMEKIAPLKHRI